MGTFDSDAALCTAESGGETNCPLVLCRRRPCATPMPSIGGLTRDTQPAGSRSAATPRPAAARVECACHPLVFPTGDGCAAARSRRVGRRPVSNLIIPTPPNIDPRRSSGTPIAPTAPLVVKLCRQNVVEVGRQRSPELHARAPQGASDCPRFRSLTALAADQPRPGVKAWNGECLGCQTPSPLLRARQRAAPCSPERPVRASPSGVLAVGSRCTRRRRGQED